MNYQDKIQQLSEAQREVLAQKLQAALGDATLSKQAKLVACIKEASSEQANVDEIKQFATSRLPAHLVPQSIQLVEDLPRNETGKLARDNLPSFSFKVIDRPAVSIDENESAFDEYDELEFVAPRNQIEQTLANIWSEVLGAGEVSVHDNFLEVGGDSLLSIRILARINKAGLSIATEDFFEYPTIAEQAKVISTTAQNSYEQGSTQGTFEIIPIQHWLFERIKIDTHHWGQNLLLEVPKSLDFASLEQALQKLLLHHDALRSVFNQEASGQWQQTMLPLSPELPLQSVDIGNITASQVGSVIEGYAKKLNSSMDLSGGSLIKLRHFSCPSSEQNQLLLTVHHLIIDGESWRILLDDLTNAWFSFANGQTPSLGAKTSSFKLWSQKLQDYAQSMDVQNELAYWQQQQPSNQCTLPEDFDNASIDNISASTQILTTHFNASETTTLLQLTKNEKVEFIELLICALVDAMGNWTNHPNLQLDIESHGREALFDKVDVSRTLGWFTTVFPVLFETHEDSDLGQKLSSVQRCLKAIPNNGIGYGVLRELTPNSPLKQQANSQVCFNYLGNTDNHNQQHKQQLDIINQNIGQVRSCSGLRAYLIEVNAQIESGQLRVDWSYSNKFHLTQTIEALADRFKQCVTALLNLDFNQLSLNITEPANTFELADLDAGELDAIANMLSDSDD